MKDIILKDNILSYISINDKDILLIFKDGIDVLPFHPLNNTSISQHTGQAHVILQDVINIDKRLTSFIDKMKNSGLNITESSYHKDTKLFILKGIFSNKEYGEITIYCNDTDVRWSAFECGSWFEYTASSSESNRKTPDEKYCHTCGKLINKNIALCPYCSTPQQNLQVKGRKNKYIAALLAFFLGSFGIHKFYLGKPIQGVLYLLFSWTGITLIISFIEAIIYLTTPEETFIEKYEKK